MNTVFWDLETTDLNTVGQIINYCFVEVDDDWNQVSECIGEVKVNRLQLPRAAAICATKTNILEHQERAEFTEYEAMQRIYSYFKERADNTAFIGFNNSSFDIPYLRTSLIRNGFSPYFKNLPAKDLYQFVIYLWSTNTEFREMMTSYLLNKDLKFTLKLEVVARALGVLEGDQDHESKSDVLLTIKVVREILRRFDTDIRFFKSYQTETYESPNYKVEAIYHFKGGNPYKANFVCLKSEGSAAWWLNLDKYEKEVSKKRGKPNYKDCIKRVKKEGSIFFVTKPAEKYEGDAVKVTLKEVDLDNFYEPSACDIEQFIYQLPFQGITSLSRNINLLENEELSFTCQAERDLFVRFRLANNQEGISNPKLKEALYHYAFYRYNGSLVLNNEGEIHPTIDELYKEIEQEKIDNPNNLVILDALKKFYDESEIVTVLGATN